jgi:hypothetical protein
LNSYILLKKHFKGEVETIVNEMRRSLSTYYSNSSKQPTTMEDYEKICLKLLEKYKSLYNYVKIIVDHQNATKTKSHYRLQYHVIFYII